MNPKDKLINDIMIFMVEHPLGEAGALMKFLERAERVGVDLRPFLNFCKDRYSDSEKSHG